MHLTLVDSEPESVAIWRAIADDYSLAMEVSASLDGHPRAEQRGEIVVLDQSAASHDFVGHVHSFFAKNQNRLLLVTGDRLDVPQVAALMRAGVRHVFEKPLSAQAIRTWFPELLAEASELFARASEYAHLKGLFSALTDRENDVLEHILNGVPNKGAAERLDVSVRTIEARRAKIYRKTETTTVVDLVRKYDTLQRLERSLVPPDTEPLSSENMEIRRVPSPNLFTQRRVPTE